MAVKWQFVVKQCIHILHIHIVKQHTLLYIAQLKVCIELKIIYYIKKYLLFPNSKKNNNLNNIRKKWTWKLDRVHCIQFAVEKNRSRVLQGVLLVKSCNMHLLVSHPESESFLAFVILSLCFIHESILELKFTEEDPIR